MSTTEQEMNDKLNELEAEHESLNQEVEEVAPEEKPPGFLSYDEWVEKGKDPADYRGENAYKKQYDALKEVRELKSTMNQVVEGMETWKQQQNEQTAIQVEQAKADAITELEKAKSDDDITAALAAQEKLNRLDSQPVSQTTNPVISDFANKNPIIDKNSNQYDSEFHQDMIMIHNGKLDQLLGGDRSRASELTPAQIDRVQKMAYTQAKELHQDKFVSPKNKRATSATSNQRPVKTNGDVSTRLKSISGNSKNPRDANPANDIYEILKAKDPKAAEVFAKNMGVE